ncbi:ribbon-helix-helix domain-containing protein [Zhihengliuella halotolerans]|uniref:ribbon-helix-helix domain-containing protein n=1 Tax=Zhihengliuella halotolerans TaxID=370736 RepID=UPI000C8061F1|nr:ribbon-helix-helix domain-containing protein [Zhihengliuella halotolerans]
MGKDQVDGRDVTEEQIQAWADEAEVGYDVDELRKRGRPRLGDGPSTVVPVRMDAELLEAVRERAEREHLTRSEAIRRAVREWSDVA